MHWNVNDLLLCHARAPTLLARSLAVLEGSINVLIKDEVDPVCGNQGVPELWVAGRGLLALGIVASGAGADGVLFIGGPATGAALSTCTAVVEPCGEPWRVAVLDRFGFLDQKVSPTGSYGNVRIQCILYSIDFQRYNNVIP